MNLSQTRTFLLLTALITGATPGCHSGLRTKPIHLYLGIDASGGARQSLGDYVILTKSALDGLTPGVDRVTIYRLDSRTHEFFDGTYDGDGEKLLTLLTSALGKPSPQRGTFPQAFWEAVEKRVGGAKETSLIALLSDGDNDDNRPSVWKGMTQSAARLSRLPHLRSITFCGASKENWKRIREMFAPLGERLALQAPEGVTAESLQGALETARGE